MTRLLSMTLGCLMMLSSVASADSAAQPARQGNRPVVVYTLSTCQDCANFKQWLRRAGVRLSTTKTRESPVSLYPTVVYSDGGADHGERVYSRQASLPRTLRIIETD